MKRKSQLVSIASAWVLVGVWLWCLLGFPKSWQNPYDSLNEVIADVAVSFAILLLGITLCVEAAFGIVKWWFALAVVATPISHYVGAALEPPLCFVLFLMPSFAIVIMSYFELRRPVR